MPYGHPECGFQRLSRAQISVIVAAGLPIALKTVRVGQQRMQRASSRGRLVAHKRASVQHIGIRMRAAGPAVALIPVLRS